MACVDVSIDPAYSASCAEYLALLCHPRLDAGMFKFQQEDWNAQFQVWSIVYAFASIIINVLFLCFRVLQELSDLALATIAADIAISGTGIVLGILFAHLGWFCIVRRQGCCGAVGYILWAVVYVLLNMGPVSVGTFMWNAVLQDCYTWQCLCPLAIWFLHCASYSREALRGTCHLSQLLESRVVNVWRQLQERF